MSCGGTQATSSPSVTTSVSPSAAPSPGHTAQPGWKTYVSARWGYSIDYPSDWFDLANFGAPDTEKYVSNENVGAPLEMSSHGVWETVEVQSNPTACPPSYVSTYVVRQSPTTVDGVATTRYVINQTPSGAEAAYLIGVWVTHGGSCYSIQFVSLTPSARDANADVADQTIASFKFGPSS
jgi:PsbP-like protein